MTRSIPAFACTPCSRVRESLRRIICFSSGRLRTTRIELRDACPACPGRRFSSTPPPRRPNATPSVIHRADCRTRVRATKTAYTLLAQATQMGSSTSIRVRIASPRPADHPSGGATSRSRRVALLSSPALPAEWKVPNHGPRYRSYRPATKPAFEPGASSQPGNKLRTREQLERTQVQIVRARATCSVAA